MILVKFQPIALRLIRVNSRGRRPRLDCLHPRGDPGPPSRSAFAPAWRSTRGLRAARVSLETAPPPGIGKERHRGIDIG